MWKSRTRRACSRDNLAMIDLQTIQQAAERLQGQVLLTPCVESRGFKDATPALTPAAQQALAIVIRTFALANRNRHRGEGYDLCDTTHCQVMRPVLPAAKAAADATRAACCSIAGVRRSSSTRRTTADLADVMTSDVIMLALPTPARQDGSCNTDVIEEFFRRVGPDSGGHFENINLVLKSTVPIGFTRKCAEKFGLRNLVHSPEFLTARCAMVDAQMPARNIVGTPNNRESAGVDALVSLYADRFPSVPVHVMTSDESEAVKLAQNSLFAMTVAFWNTVEELCGKTGMDFTTIRNAIIADGRVSRSHCNVPGPDGKRGAGGTCLPKDINNFIRCCADADVNADMLADARDRNARDRTR